jgi:hypothetical protein
MALLITYSYLRTETDISQTIDNKDLDNPIKRAQDQLKFMLGPAFYNELVSENDANSMSANNTALYDPYVKQFLAWQAYQFWIIKSPVYATKIGMRQFREDNSDPASDKIIGEMIRDAKETTQSYKGALLSFLKAQQTEDSTKYPLYTNKDHVSMAGGFHVTAITNRDKKSSDINRELFNNG